MPATYIRQKTQHGDPDTAAPAVKIGWAKKVGRTGSREWQTGHIQVATVAKDGMKLDPTPEGNGWFVTLDRDAANQLIRDVRTARDQAFGADA